MERKQFHILLGVLAAGSLTAFLLFQILKMVQRQEGNRDLSAHALASFQPVGETQRPAVLGKPTLLIHFLPDCHFCQNEAKALGENLTLFQDVRLILISSASPSSLRDFAREFGLSQQPDIHLLHDSERRFADFFGTRAVPAVFIYDAKGRLQKKYRGETKIETILSHLNPSTHEAIMEETR